MVVRLLFKPEIRRTLGATRRIALASAALLTPVAVMAFALGVWRIAADLKLTGPFAIESGPLSNWQPWIALGILLEASAVLLVKFAGRGLTEMKPN